MLHKLSVWALQCAVTGSAGQSELLYMVYHCMSGKP